MKTYGLQIMAGKETCGDVTVNENGRVVHCDEWHGIPVEKYFKMVERNALKLIEEWTSSVGNHYYVHAN